MADTRSHPGHCHGAGRREDPPSPSGLTGWWAPVLALALLGSGCTPAPPPRWQPGGAPLRIGPATWQRPDDDTVEIRENGEVVEDGDVIFVIDVVGRVVDDDYDPAAILLPSGFVVGTDNVDLGRVGVSNASPPGQTAAWLSVLPDGTVQYYDIDGERSHGGTWRGCAGPQLRTCTLVTHLFGLRAYARQPQGGVGIGVGVGVGVYR